MRSILWKGKLSPVMKASMAVNTLLAAVLGRARDTLAMKGRVRLGFEGACSPALARYDDLGSAHYHKIAEEVLGGLELRDREVLDVGCGTGILSLLAGGQGLRTLTCGDLSERMLASCRAKMAAPGIEAAARGFVRLDAESLPFGPESFDVVLSGMVLGMLPDQAAALRDMARVLRRGGVLALSTHAPDHYYQPTEASFRALPRRLSLYFLGYCPEFWPLTEGDLTRMLAKAGLREVRVRRLVWHDDFPDGGQSFEFFAGTSGMWSLARLPPGKRPEAYDAIRRYFVRRRVTRITHDVLIAHARKA